MGLNPSLLLLIEELAHALENASIGHGLDELDAFLEKFPEGQLGSLLDDFFIDRPVIFQEEPDIIKIPVGRFFPFEHGHQLMRKHILPDHDEHGYAQVILELVAGAKQTSIDLDFDVGRIFFIREHEEERMLFLMLLPDRSEFLEYFFYFGKYDIFSAFIQEIEIQVDRESAQIIEEVAGRSAFEAQNRAERGIGVNLLQYLKQDRLVKISIKHA